MFLFRQAQQLPSQQGAARQIKWTMHFFADSSAGPCVFVSGRCAQIDYRKKPLLERSNDLNRLAVGRRKGRAQNVVSPDNFIETFFEKARLDFSGKSQDDGQVIGIAAGLDLIDQPQALLRKRKRRGLVCSSARNGWLAGGRFESPPQTSF